jgi:hypothetical protein
MDALTSEAGAVPPSVFVEALLKTGFSPDAYRDACDDLRHMTPGEALGHYLRHGIFEARRFPFEVKQHALVELAALHFGNADFKAQLLADVARNMLRDLAQPWDAAIAECWATISSLVEYGAHPYFITGDSHSTHYVIAEAQGSEWLMPIHLLCHGGSAHGLGKSGSRTGYGEQLRQSIDVIRSLPGAHNLPFLIQFGQVDIEFVYNFRRAKENRRKLDLDGYRWFCSETEHYYTTYLRSVFDQKERANVFVISVFPPALSDEALRRGILNDVIVRAETGMTQEEMAVELRRLELANLRERTEIHREYNKAMNDACISNGFCFVDGYTPFLGTDGLVDEQYLIPEAYGFDHHLDSRRTRPIVASLIWDIVRREPPRAG